MILVEYPLRLINNLTHGQRETTWINKDLAVRLRREDSIWAVAEDDHAWHRTQDAKITHRPDPWNIYSQEFPDAGDSGD